MKINIEYILFVIFKLKELRSKTVQFVAFAVLTVTLISCEDPGSVGQEISDLEAEVVTDTLEVDSLSNLTTDAFSGDKPFVTAGIYTDPIFGKFEAVALLRPAIASPVTDTIAPDARVTTMDFTLFVNENNVWGDTSSTANFKLVEIGEKWDENNWRYGDEPVLNDRVLGEFALENTDSVKISIQDRAWIEEYARIFNMEPSARDSVFEEELFGFAVVPQNESKLVPFSVSDARLLVSTTTLADDLQILIFEEAISLKRSKGVIHNENAFELNSTYNNASFFQFNEFVDKVETPAISAAFMVMKRQDSLLANSLPENHIRPTLNETRSFFRSSEDAKSLLETGTSLGVPFAIIEEDDNLRANFTNDIDRVLINEDNQVNLFLIYGLNNGIIRSSLYFGTNHPRFNPRFFITRLQP